MGLPKKLYLRKDDMRLKMSVCLVGVLSLLLSCASQPIDKGAINPENVPEEDLVTVYINAYTVVDKVDNIEINWPWDFDKFRFVKISSGDHTFEVRFRSGSSYTMSPVSVPGRFERGNTYLLISEIKGNRVSFHFYLYNDNQKGAEVTLYPNNPPRTDPDIAINYLKYVITPTSDKTENSVRLENENYILLFKPDMVYTLTDKKTRKTTEGRRGFAIDYRMSEGKAYLFETDITKMSREQFLKSNYTEEAQIVLAVTKCSETSVTYKYEKPLELKGTEVTFTITEIKK